MAVALGDGDDLPTSAELEKLCLLLSKTGRYEDDFDRTGTKLTKASIGGCENKRRNLAKRTSSEEDDSNKSEESA